jgi:hypothetical protein
VDTAQRGGLAEMAGGGMEIFRVQELITNLQSRVSSLASFGDWIFVGTQDGQVSQYVVEKTSDGIKGVYIEKKRFLNHGKKPVEQILALEGGVLLTLCDGQVDVLSASSLDVQFSFTSIKNAQVLCTDKVTFLSPSLPLRSFSLFFLSPSFLFSPSHCTSPPSGFVCLL